MSLQVLVESGMSENEARSQLGLPLVHTEEDHPPWVTYYEPPEDEDEDLTPEALDEKQFQKLTDQFARMIQNMGTADAPAAIARMFLESGRTGEEDATESHQVPPAPCPLCGVLLSDLELHMSVAHPK